MAEDENIYYIQKQEQSDITLDTSECVWQDAYTEVVAYEENVEDSMNITYVTEGNESSSENYETATEDNSQYYSVIEANDTLEQTLQPIDDHAELDLSENYKGDLAVLQYSAENEVKHEFDEQKVDNIENTIVEDDDQVILYKIEDSNELFAVQIARDADGNIQKYQYKVRQNEDGQLEAVPGTIQIQPEGTEQLICEEPITDKDLPVNENLEEIKEEQFENVYNEQPESDELLKLNDETANIEETEEQIYETNGQYDELEAECQYEDDANEVVEKIDDENNQIEYLKQDEAEVLQHTGGDTYYCKPEDGEEEEFENIEYLQEEEDEGEIQYEQLEENYIEDTTEHIIPDMIAEPDPQYVKQYSPNSQVEVLSNILMESNTNVNALNNNTRVQMQQEHATPPNNAPKQILNKLSDITFANESIELKRINSGAASKQANKLTFLIVTHPEEKPTLPKHFSNKKFRSILRPTIHQQNLQKTNYAPAFKVNCKPVKHKVEVPMSKTVLNHTAPTLVKGPRQPRKQIITPVDRVGSEIIIQAPEEKDLPVETYDLDAFSDEEYSPKAKPRFKKIPPTKRRGKKPAVKLPENIPDSNAKDGDVDQTTDADGTKNSSKRKDKSVVEVKKVEKPKFDKVLPVRKRGRPGRPKLSEKNKLNLIEKEVISSGSVKGGQSGRPKFIRTTRKISNGKQKNDFKENDDKPRIEKVEDVVEADESSLITPKRRGRPPKKYTPDDESVTRKRKNSSDDSQSVKNDVSDKYFGFCSDSEIEEKDAPPAVKKPKTDEVVDAEKKDIVDDLLSEMQDIHGVADEEPIKIEEAPESTTETETLLSILETSNEKEDVLTRALKSANIITPSDGEETVAPVKQCIVKSSANDFLDVNKVKAPVEEAQNVAARSTKKPVYKCTKCAKTFVKYLSFKSHVQEHKVQNKGKFNCNKCSRIFLFESALQAHEKTAHLQCDDGRQRQRSASLYKCAECSATFKTVLQLKTHQVSQHKTFKCDKCSRIFSARSEFLSHVRSSHMDADTKSRTFRRSTQVKREFSDIIQSISNTDKTRRKTTMAVMTTTAKNVTTATPAPPSDTHRCNVCMKTFRQLAHLVMHRDVHNKPTCTNCGKVFPFKHVLSEHMRRYCLKSPKATHRVRSESLNVNSSRTTSYDCEKCKKTFKNQLFYNSHMRMYHKAVNNKQLKKVLNDSLKRKIKPATHQATTRAAAVVSSAASISERRQSDRKQVPTKKVMPIRCEMCDLSFTTYTGLFRHTLSHPDIKEKCDHCDAGFETKTQLQNHLRTHINVECRRCRATFKAADELQKHSAECVSAERLCDNKSVLLTARKSIHHIPKKNFAHGGIPLSLKLKNKLLKRKL